MKSISKFLFLSISAIILTAFFSKEALAIEQSENLPRVPLSIRQSLDQTCIDKPMDANGYIMYGQTYLSSDIEGKKRIDSSNPLWINKNTETTIYLQKAGKICGARRGSNGSEHITNTKIHIKNKTKYPYIDSYFGDYGTGTNILAYELRGTAGPEYVYFGKLLDIKIVPSKITIDVKRKGGVAELIYNSCFNNANMHLPYSEEIAEIAKTNARLKDKNLDTGSCAENSTNLYIDKDSLDFIEDPDKPKINGSIDSYIAAQSSPGNIPKNSPLWKTGIKNKAKVGDYVSIKQIFKGNISLNSAYYSANVVIATRDLNRMKTIILSKTYDNATENDLRSDSLIFTQSSNAAKTYNSNFTGELLVYGDLNPSDITNDARYNKANPKYKITSQDEGKYICVDNTIAGLITSHDKTTGVSVNQYTAKPSNMACVYVERSSPKHNFNQEIIPCIKHGQYYCGSDDELVPVSPGEQKAIYRAINNISSSTVKNVYIRYVAWKRHVLAEKYSYSGKLPLDYNSVSSSPTLSVADKNIDAMNMVNEIHSDIDIGDNRKVRSATIMNEISYGDTVDSPNGMREVDWRYIKIPDNAILGQVFCYSAAVTPAKIKKGEPINDPAINKRWRLSKPVCFIVAKKPKMEFWSGIYSKGGIRTSVSNRSTTDITSWSEFEAIAGLNGPINGFTSNSSYISNHVTFKNKNQDLGKWGDWGSSSINNTISGIQQRYNKTDANIEIKDLRNQAKATLGRSTQSKITEVVYGKDIYISGDQIIDYDTDYSERKFDRIKQRIIIADNIYIDKDVERIDAWLISRGKIVTCAGGFKDDTSYDSNS